MTRERFIEMLEAYGADPARWPDAERDDAQAWAAEHPDAVETALLVEAKLDALLGPAEAVPSDLLQRRLLQRAPRPAVSFDWHMPVAAAAALVIGVMAGFAGGAVVSDPITETEAIYADAFGGLGEDWVDWLGEEA